MRNRFEMLAVLLTATLNVVADRVFPSQAMFIAVAAISWLVYFAICIHGDRGILGVWGFRREGARASFVVTSLFAIVAILLMAWVGWWRGIFLLHVHMLPLLLLYPLWGYLQHLLMLGVFLRGMTQQSGALSEPKVAIPITAILFGVIHAPDPELIAGTAILGAFFGVVYLKWRNLWPLGLYHGWLGVFMYFWVLGQDPWREVFAASN